MQDNPGRPEGCSGELSQGCLLYTSGETCGTLEEDGIPSLVMADGPAGIRLRQWYEVDKETDSIYEMGVLGSLENGILEPGVHHVL